MQYKCEQKYTHSYLNEVLLIVVGGKLAQRYIRISEKPEKDIDKSKILCKE